MRRLTCNNLIAYLKNWTDNFFQIFFMGTSWVAVSINNIKTRASREMTSRKNINIFDFNGVNVAKHWHVAGEVFAISDCLVIYCIGPWVYEILLQVFRGGGGGFFWVVFSIPFKTSSCVSGHPKMNLLALMMSL